MEGTDAGDDATEVDIIDPGITPRSHTTTIKITHLDLIRFLLPELLVTNLTWSQLLFCFVSLEIYHRNVLFVSSYKYLNYGSKFLLQIF